MKKNYYTRGFGLLEGFLARKRADRANSLIPNSHRDGRILDIGCGSYPYFLTSTDFKEKYGIDPSVNIKNINEKNLFLLKEGIDNKNLPFNTEFFDVITMLAVFEHIDKDKLVSVLSEGKRLLKKEGILIITTPSSWSDKLLHFMAQTGLISKEEIHEHKHNHQKSKIEDIIKDAGFNPDKIKSGYFELGFNMWFTAIK